MIGYRDSCAPVEVSFPAATLGDARVARWLREHRLAVDVRTLAELHSAISVGIHPLLMTVHADQLDTGDIRRVSAAGVGRVVLSHPEQITPLRNKHTQNVLLRMTNAVTNYSDVAVDAVIGCRSTTLIGLLCELDGAADEVGCPAAIGNMIAQMDHIRRRHNIVLTRLILGVGDAAPAAAGSVARRDLAEEIDESVDDACATLRFPRPTIVMAA
ncbi:Orn/DAP/Arg decarboxylase 2 [uncultured Mycobacterium sp.]|uniref:Orn/DAP/Arg decarboxylase 2 n=1 Tax=uncultured Mycobacterium sp. TaxID=171292 RepID=A0A1Y5PAL5_9MYCO|nr:Orn/DAP/Arg decarboxylase 2 [uncultured Mycobacterium sp.]